MRKVKECFTLLEVSYGDSHEKIFPGDCWLKQNICSAFESTQGSYSVGNGKKKLTKLKRDKMIEERNLEKKKKKREEEEGR